MYFTVKMAYIFYFIFKQYPVNLYWNFYIFELSDIKNCWFIINYDNSIIHKVQKYKNSNQFQLIWYCLKIN